jgi:hypothetical protein
VPPKLNHDITPSSTISTLHKPYPIYSPLNLLIPTLFNNVPSISTPLPSSLSPLLIANSVNTLPICLVGVIIPLYATLNAGIIILLYSACFGINGWISGCAVQSTPPGRTL